MYKKFKGLLLALLTLALVANAALPAMAQNPTGSIRGVVKDEQGAVVSNTTVTVKNKATGETRKGNAGDDGLYTFSNLQPGEYEVTFEAQNFAQRTIPATVQVGSSTSVDVTLTVGGGSEIIDVQSAGATLEKESTQIAGVINQKKIDALPLNGRNFLQLALLEPGVGVSTRAPGAQNNLFNVSIGGASSAATRLTVDGGSIVDPVCGGAAQNFSTETVQEFQISTFNFDLSTGVTSVGAINIVSRTGTNDLHGSGFLYYRDHNLSAVPTLRKPTEDFDPFFRRFQYGASVGGPIKKNKAFFFSNIEWLAQDDVVSIVHTGPNIGGVNPFTQFDTTFPSPYNGLLFNSRVDVDISSKHKFFGRYSFDNNDTLAPDAANALPSNWRFNENNTHNAQAGLTTLFTSKLVNDLRFNYQRIANDNPVPTAEQCPDSDPGCIGRGGVQINVNGSNIRIGNTVNAPQFRRLDRYQTVNNVSWEKGAHRVRFGGEWEHNYGYGGWAFLDPGLLVVHNPADVLATNAAIAAAPLPAQVKAALTIPISPAFSTPGARLTLQDLLSLPLIAGAVGIGDPSQPPPFNGDIARRSNRFRFFGQDTWRVRPNITLLFGAAYQFETNLANFDLEKPALIAPLIGETGRPSKDKNNIAPSVGFTWDVGSKGKTVVRAGAGIYYDTILFVTRLRERATNGPAGNGRSQVATIYFQNSFAFPQIPGLPAPLNQINPALGTPIDFRTIPTKFTAANFLTLYNAQAPVIQTGLRQAGEAGFAGLDFFKTGTDILDPNLETPYTEQFTAGVQHQLRRDMVLNVDFVLRKGVHSLFQNDYNLANRVASLGGPRIPRCVGAAAINPAAQCSNGPISVITSSGRSDYRAMLVKFDKRFSNRYQLTASYALQSRTQFFTGENLFDWFANRGPAGGRHALTISGVLELPKGFQASLIAIYNSPDTNNARIAGSIDFNGDGTTGDTLLGLPINSLGRGTSKRDLIRIVDEFNRNFAGRPDARGATIPTVVLPPNFQFNDSFISHDIRLSKAFRFGESERFSWNFFVEAFNVFNIANLTGFSATLNSSFGQATGRAGQNFGTGGPRAFQLGSRISF